MLIFKTIKTYIKYLTTIYEKALKRRRRKISQYIVIVIIMARCDTQAHK